jgi:hypothetical protein
MALQEVCGLLLFTGLTLELSRPARAEPVGAEAAKRARLERIVRPLISAVRENA